MLCKQPNDTVLGSLLSLWPYLASSDLAPIVAI